MIDTNNDYILEINNLCKCYGDNSILNNINLKIKKGEIYGILGFSGAGKSTLVRCINGLEKYDSGEIIFNGKKALFDCNYRRDISMIFQTLTSSFAITGKPEISYSNFRNPTQRPSS